MDLQELKMYLRIDGNDEDALIQSLQVAAETSLENSGVRKDYANELYKLAVRLMVSEWYENRIVNAVGSHSAKLQFSLDTIIMQIKYNQADETAEEVAP